MKGVFFSWLVLFCSPGFAQVRHATLTGSLVMQTGEVFPYKLVLTDSGNVVKGYSYTYKEPEETKTAIRGMLDKHMRTLSFKEKDIVYSHTVQTKAYMCLVNASLEYVQDGSGKALKGSITSREADNTSCTPGEIIFKNDKELQDLYNEAATIVPLYETPYPVCWRKNVKGFTQIPLGNNYFFATAPEA